MERAIEILKQQKEGLEWVVNNIQDAEESKLTLTDVNKALQLLQTGVICSTLQELLYYIENQDYNYLNGDLLRFANDVKIKIKQKINELQYSDD